MRIPTDKIARRRERPLAPEPNGRAPRRRLADRLGYRTRTLGLALLLAIVAVVLTTAYVRSYKRGVEAGVANARVLVAARDIPAGTTGAALRSKGLVRVDQVPRRSVVPGAISGVAQLRDLAASDRIYAGEQITARRFRPVAAGGLRGELTGALRAFAVSGDRNQLLAGIIRQGDRVDVVATAAQTGAAGGGERVLSGVVLRDLLVLGAPESTTSGGATPGRGSSVVLALTDRQAQKLFLVAKHGQWALLLRPFGRSAESAGRAEDLGDVFGEAQGGIP